MKKMILALSLIFMAASAQANDFEVSLQSNEVTLIDSSGKTCAQQIVNPTGEDNISPAKALVGSIGLKWTGKNPLRLLYVKIEFNGEGIWGNYTSFVASGSELGYMWNGNKGLVNLEPQDAVRLTSTDCSVEFGGVVLNDRTVTTSGEGVVTAYGTTMDGQMKSVTATTKFTWNFNGSDR